jgi:hypothetical protein
LRLPALLAPKNPEAAELILALIELALKAVSYDLLLIRIRYFREAHHDQVLVRLDGNNPNDLAFEFGMGERTAPIA